MRAPKLHANAEAILWVVIGTAIFSLTMSSGKFAGAYLGLTISTTQIMVMRYFGACVAVLLIILSSSKPLRAFRSNRPASHCIRALFGFASGWLLIQSATRMPSVDATALSLLYVVFVVILGVIILRERLTRQHLMGIALCCAGAAAIMASRGAFERVDAGYAWPALLAVTGAVLTAVEGLLIKMLALADRPIVTVAHINVFALIVAIPAAMVDWHPLAFSDLLPFALLGPLALLAQYCFVRGYSLADIAVVGPAEYVWLIYSALIGMFFGEVPTIGVLAGAMVIAGGGITLATIRPRSEEATIPAAEELA